MNQTPPRKLLIVNPNANFEVTAWLAAEARRLIGASAEVIAVNADSGLPAIQTPEDLQRASESVVSAVLACPGASGVLIAAFGDPGLRAARAQSVLPIVGLGESGILAAARRGRRFSILTMGVAMRAPISAKVAELGVGGQWASLRFLPFGIAQFVADREAWRPVVAAAARACVENDGAEVVLLGGAPFAGLGRPLRLELGLEISDGVEAGIGRLGM